MFCTGKKMCCGRGHSISLKDRAEDLLAFTGHDPGRRGLLMYARDGLAILALPLQPRLSAAQNLHPILNVLLK